MLFFFMFLIQAEARVFCQDSNARKWEPLGFSCPVNCGNVITAIKKLRASEYNQLFANPDYNVQIFESNTKTNANNIKINAADPSTTDKADKNNITNEDITYDDIRRMSTKMYATYKRYYKMLNNEMVVNDLKIERKASLDRIKDCYANNEVKRIFWNKCTRRSNMEVDFLKKFTSILNKYTNSVPFTEELTGMILERVLGNNLDLRHGLFDVNKIIEFLSTAIRNHENSWEARHGQVINLRSRHCLNINVPGCFCMPGFVEKSGQCVLPSDCFDGVIEKDLLARLVVY